MLPSFHRKKEGLDPDFLCSGSKLQAWFRREAMTIVQGLVRHWVTVLATRNGVMFRKMAGLRGHQADPNGAAQVGGRGEPGGEVSLR